MLRFNRNYFVFALVLLIVEIAIALFVNDNFLRPYGGDTIAVVLLYCILRAAFRFPYRSTAFAAWCFACCLEAAQATNLLFQIGLHENKIARTVVGTSFSWLDILAYTAGFFLIILCEKLLQEKQMGEIARKQVPGKSAGKS